MGILVYLLRKVEVAYLKLDMVSFAGKQGRDNTLEGDFFTSRSSTQGLAFIFY